MTALSDKELTVCTCDECYADFEAHLPEDWESPDWDAIKCPHCGSDEFGWMDNGPEDWDVA